MSPIRVDFYLLSDESPTASWLVACRLLEKAYFKGHKVFVSCQNQHDAELLDELLWTFKDDSFIPHNLQGEGPEPPPPIQIGYSQEPRGFNDVLLNCQVLVPTFYSKFKRIIEIVPASIDEKARCRERYKTYRSMGCKLFTHPL